MEKSIFPAPSLEPKSKSQIANEMNISLRTFQRKLKKYGFDIPRGHIYPDQQNLIYEAFGYKGLLYNGTK